MKLDLELERIIHIKSTSVPLSTIDFVGKKKRRKKRNEKNPVILN